MVSALRYFKTIIDKMAVDRKVLEMLPGSASKVLEAILPLAQLDPKIQNRWMPLFCHLYTFSKVVLKGSFSEILFIAI